jgi:hypothetical protein
MKSDATTCITFSPDGRTGAQKLLARSVASPLAPQMETNLFSFFFFS